MAETAPETIPMGVQVNLKFENPDWLQSHNWAVTVLDQRNAFEVFTNNKKRDLK